MFLELIYCSGLSQTVLNIDRRRCWKKQKKNKNRPIEKKYVAKQRIANLVYQNTAAAETFVFALTYFFLYPNHFI